MLFSAVSDEIEIFSKWRCISSIVCVHSTIFIEQDLGSCIHIYDEFLNRLAFAGTATPAYHFFFLDLLKAFQFQTERQLFADMCPQINRVRSLCAGISFQMEDKIHIRDSLYLITTLSSVGM